MASIAEIRAKFPQYGDMSDQQLADALYAKYYSDMPRTEFDAKISGAPASPPSALQPGSREYAQWAVEQARSGAKLPQVSKVIEAPSGAPTDLMSKLFAASGSAIEGVPIAGPTLIDLAKKGRAAFQGMTPEAVNEEYAAAREANPISSTAGGIAGAVLPLAGLGAVPGLGRVLGMTGGLPSQAFFGGVSGAGIAAADTMARGGTPNDALGSSLIGGGLGATLPFVGAGLSSLLGRSVPKYAQNIGRALRDDGLTPADILPKMGALGPDAMLMDLGPNLQAQAGALAAVPGKAQKIVRDAVTGRASAVAKSARVADDVARTIGAGPDIDLLTQNILQAQKAAADPLYAAIRDVPIPTLQGNFAFVFSTPMGKQALKDGIELAANDGVRFNAKGLTVGMIDYAKRALDDIAREAARAGKNNKARQAGDLARVLRTEADKVVPGYRQARDAFAGPAAVLEAIEEGAKAFTKDVTPAQLTRNLAAMTASERDAFLQGAQSWVESQMGNAVNDAVSLRNMFRKGWNEGKLRAILGDTIADDLLRRIDREMLFGETTNVVARNSETARRAASMGEVTSKETNLSQANWFGAILAAFNKARQGLGGAMQAQTNARMAQGLSATGATFNPRMVQDVQKAFAGRGANLLAPAVPGAIVSDPNKREPLMITVRGGRP